MDNGLLVGIIALIIFSILLVISINNDAKNKREKDFTDILKTCSNEDQTNTLLTELLKTEKSSNTKLNIIIWIMLIPIIVNIVILFSMLLTINEVIEKFTSLL